MPAETGTNRDNAYAKGRSKPLKHDNGKGGERRTPAQLERQERVYVTHVITGKTVREIAAGEGVSKNTIVADIRQEAQRRADEIATRRETETARAIAYYENVAAMALRKGAMYDRIAQAGGKVVDHTLESMIKARERIDKLLGLDAPTKVDLGLQMLLDALEPKS